MTKFFSLIVFIFAFLGLQAQKDTSTVVDLFDMTLEELMNQEVSGVSRYKQSISDVPNSIQVISKQQITDRGYNDLIDLLKDIPGFDITESAGRFGEFYSFRGVAGNDRFLVLVNGHELNPASGTFISLGNSISIRYAERIEIIYGPASAVYGADAFSGIINIVLNEEAAQQDVTASYYANYGSFNTIDAGIETALKLNDDLSLYLNARLFNSQNFDVAGNSAIYDVILNYPARFAKESQQLINDHSIYFKADYKNFSFNYYRQQFDEGNAFGHNPAIYIYDESNKWKTSTDMFWGTYKKEFQNAGILSFDLMYKNHVQDESSMFHKWVSFANGTTYEQYMTGKDKTIQGVLSYNQNISEKFQFIAGMDFENTISIPPYANDEVLGNSYQYIGENAETIDDELTITENRFAAFGQFLYSPVDFVTILFGSRYDYSSNYEGVFNPRAGLIISPTQTTKLKFIYGKAFQAPSLFYQYEQFGTPSVVMLSQAEVQKTEQDWKLQNQIVNSYEFSLTQQITENYNFKISAYYNDLTNLIERNLYTTAVYNKYFNSTTGGFRNENIGSQKILGGDLLLNAKLSRKLLAYAFYSYTDAVAIDKNDNEIGIPRISEHKIWIGLTVQDLFNYLTLSPRFRWVSEMYNANTATYPDNIQPGYSTLDLNFSINRLGKFFRIYADFQNILNKKNLHGGLYGQSGVYTAAIPQAGFNFNLGVEIEFNK